MAEILRNSSNVSEQPLFKVKSMDVSANISLTFIL